MAFRRGGSMQAGSTSVRTRRAYARSVPTVPAALTALALPIQASIDAVATCGQSMLGVLAATVVAAIDPAAFALQPVGATGVAERGLVRRALVQVRLDVVATTVHPLPDARAAVVQAVLDPVAASIQALFDAVAAIHRGGAAAGQQGHRGQGGGQCGGGKSIHGGSLAGPILQGIKRPRLRAVDHRGDGFRPRL
jgi:hypothetical protein